MTTAIPPDPMGWEQMRRDVAEIRALVEARLSDDKTKERAFERLYEELDALKKNKAFEDNRPLYMDLVLLYDRVGGAIKEHTGPICDVLRSLQEELTEILSHRDIDVIETTGDSFDPVFQTVMGTQAVDSEALEGKVVCILRDGFKHRGTVLRAQEVILGRYHPSAMNPEASRRCGECEEKTSPNRDGESPFRQ